MQSLFVRPAPKKGRVLVMLGASLLLHGGLVGIGALWTPPDPPPHTVPIDWGDFPGPAGPPPVPVPSPTNDPIDSTPTPSTPEPTVPTPPVVDDKEFSEPVQTPPPRKLSVSRPPVKPRSVRTLAAAGSNPSQPNGGVTGVQSSAVAGPSANGKAWFTPHPPYPARGLNLHVTGATTVRITTDATGQVSNVVIVRSAGNPVLDTQTENYVRTNWHGPPNATRTTEFVYEIR